MNILIIEDQTDWIQDVAKAADSLLTIFSPEDVGLLGFKIEEGCPAEDQIEKKLLDVVTTHKIDLVLLDTDLSRAKGDLQPQSGYRVALQELGIPVCRYQKGGTETKFSWWQRLQRVAVDGASAVWVSREMVNGEKSDQLAPWLKQMAEGFQAITEKLDANPKLLEDGLGPSDVLAIVLDRPDAKSDFLGYSAQNFFFFAAPNDADATANYPSPARRYATRLGYWLYNYIMMFPGPILSSAAAAAMLNLQLDSFGNAKVQALLSECRYNGPFGQLDAFYWRDSLAEKLDELEGDIARAPELSDLGLKRVDSDDPSATAYLCVLSHEAILQQDAASNPDWIPPGAYQARIKAEHLDELGPLLGI